MTTVLQVIPSLDGGGAETACIDIAAALVAAGHKAIVVSKGGRGVQKLIACGAEHITRDVATKNPFGMMRNAVWLAGLISRRSVDIVHVRSRAPAWSVRIASRLAKFHFVTTVHAAYKFSSELKKSYNRSMMRSDRVIAISHYIAEYIRKNYKVPEEKLRIIPRGVDSEALTREAVDDQRCAALRKAWGIDKDTPIVLCPARLSPIKGQAVLIEAMAQLPRDLNHIHAVIVGSDQGRTDYRRELQGLISQFNLKERVHLVKHCDDMPAAYKTAELVVATSLVPEGFGRVPVEAMCMGVPVIATNLGGFVETIRDGISGWLVPANSPSKLANTIAALANLSPAQISAVIEAAQQNARALYDKRKMVADTLKVYDELTR